MHKYRDHAWECSLKLDGSSMTVYLNDDNFGVCSRNLDLTETDDNAFWQVARKLKLEENMRTLGRNVAVQGELMGPGVQGNREQFKELRFFVFDVWDIDRQEYLHAYDRWNVVTELGLEHVPVYENVKLGFDDAEGFLQYAEYGHDGKSINHPEREGLVFKSLDDPNVSFKAISNAFLLKGGD
jgi:RNA ligase (TIGR02306 family)